MENVAIVAQKENQKVFVSFINQSKERFFLAIENGGFYQLRNNRAYHEITYEDLIQILVGFSKGKFKMQGFGYYGKSILAK